MTLDRNDYKTAIPQLEKKLESIKLNADNGLANIAKLTAALDAEIRKRVSGDLKNATEMAQMVVDFDQDIANLQDQIDGNITTWFYNYEPTLTNPPASTWTTTAEMNNHLGDLFYNTNTGYAYRFMLYNGTYSWDKLSDQDLTKALQDAAAAQDTADHKRRVFISQPIPPYDEGDLWCEGAGGDILTCTYHDGREEGESFVSTDWAKLNKYTDDTYAENIKVGGRNLFKDSANLGSTWGKSSSTVSGGVATLTRTTAETRIYQLPANGYWSWQPSTTYVASIEAKTSNSGATLRINCNASTSTYQNGRDVSPTSEWKRYSVVFTTGSTVTTSSMEFKNITDNTAIQVRYPKLELGNKPTEWTPAPEDIEAAANAEEQRIYYRSSSNTKPNGNGLPTAWVTETGDKYNTNATTSSGWSRKITPMASSVSGTKYIYLWTCIQRKTVDGTVTYGDILLDDSTTIIDGGSIVTGSIDANRINVTDLNASNAITIGALNTDTQNSILNDNIKLGGENLLKNTEYMWPYAFGTSVVRQNDASSGFNNCFKMTGTTENWSSNINTMPTISKDWLDGETYHIFSFDYFIPSTSIDVAINIICAGSDREVGVQGARTKYRTIANPTLTTKGKWQRANLLINPMTEANLTSGSGNVNSTYFNFYNRSNGGIIYVKNFKFEEGNKATAWSPAPDDENISGRNILLGSGDYSNWQISSSFSSNISISGEEETISVSGKTSNFNAGAWGWLSKTYNEIKDEELVVSFDVYSSDWSSVTDASYPNNAGLYSVNFQMNTTSSPLGTTIYTSGFPYLFMRLGSTSGFWKVKPRQVNSNWLHFESKPFKLSEYFTSNASATPGDYVVAKFQLRMNGTVKMRHMKVEIGNKATAWTVAPEDVDADIEDASKVATDYVTKIDSNGIWVTPPNKKPTNTATGAGATGTKIDGDGLQIFKSGNSVAFYGDSARIGKEDNSHIEMDWRSFKLVDRDGDTYVYFSDLRDSDGTFTETFTGDGSTKTFTLMFFISSSYTVKAKINGTATTAFTYTAGTNTVTFNSAPANNATITIQYTPTLNVVKAFSIGERRDGDVGLHSVCIGYDNLATYRYSQAFGTGCKSKGIASIAMGATCEATGDESFACGDWSKASGGSAFAAGWHTEASGTASVAIGAETKASASYSHAQNRGTVADKQYQTAIGKYNTTNITNNLFVIGKGSSSSSRSNALTVDTSGNEVIAGTLTQSSDRRLKEHIDYLDNDAVEFIRGLKPAHYIKDDEHHVGFYAQDVEEIDKWDCMVGEMNDYKTLGYTEIIAPLVAYCQKLEQRITELERGSNE